MSQNRKDSSLRAVFRKLTGVIQDYFKGEVSVDTAIRQVTELLSVHLQVPRVSIWVMANDIEGRRIDQLDLYQAKNSTHSSGARILEKDYPRYFQTIDKDMILPIRDARRDRRTSEFRDSYLKPSGIFSLMDGPIHVHGKVAGVICCEQTGTYREWTDAEEEVLLSACTKVSSLLSLRSLEAEVRARSEQICVQQAQVTHSAQMASIGAMAGGIAHEINTPLCLIRILSETMLRKLDTDQIDRNECRKDIQLIDQTVERISRIVLGLRRLTRTSRSDEKRLDLVCNAVNDAIELSRERLKNDQIEVRCNIDPHLLIHCKIVEIGQVMLNLISNCRDAIAGTPGAWIEIVSSKENGCVRVTVTDSGKGIAPEIASRIMEPFFTTKAANLGTGLGLSISKSIVEDHGGRFFYDPSYENTRFVLEFPAVESNDDADRAVA